MKSKTDSIVRILRDRRVDLGLSQQEVANRAQVSRRTYAQVELGQRTGSTITLRRIEQALELPIGSINGERPPDDPEVVALRRELMDLVNTMDARELRLTRLDIMKRHVANLEEQLNRYKEAADLPSEA